MTFEDKVRRELKGLSEEQQKILSFRCALCVFPFLGAYGHFNFWKKESIQKDLYDILKILDLFFLMRNFKRNDNFFVIPYEQEGIIDTVSNIMDSSNVISGIGFPQAKYTARAIAYAAYTVTEASIPSDNKSVLMYASQVLHNNSDTTITTNFILNGIHLVKQNIKSKISITDYGDLWNNFKTALNKEGCSYWANWYQQLFENNFEFDVREIKQRLHLPQEVKVQGASAVGAEMERILREGSERLNEARVIILGDKGVGKTCVARKLRDPKAPMTKKNESTSGVDTTLWKLETATDSINVRIWDFAGHTVTHAAHQFFLSERSLYILVYDGRSEERNRLRYWLDHVKNYGGTNSKAIILVNEQDAHTVDIPINTLKEEYPIEGIYSFNIKSDTKKLQNFRKIVSDYIIHNPSWEKQQISKSYYQVKNELENLFAKNVAKDNEFIKKEQFLEIAKKHAIEDEDADTLLKSLHALGISLWYPKLGTYNTLILNPEWISDGVYKIINWVNNEDTHTILLSKFSKVFEGEEKRFPKEKHTFLFDLMIEYELAYTLNKKRLVIPHLLNEDQPKKLPVFENVDSLLLRFETNQILPSNTISRFIVRHHTNIKIINKKPQVWRYGVILEDKSGSIALVKEKDRAISVSIKGGDKTQFISTIRKSLQDIFDTYKSLEPELSYKIIDNELDPNRELFLTEQKIVNHVSRNKKYYDDVSNLDIPLNAVVKVYNITNHHYHGNIQTLVGRDHIGDITNTTLNFNECSLDLQGSINDLIEKISRGGDPEDIEELKEISELLEKLEDQEDKEKIEKTLKKKNIPKRFARFFKDLGDEDSTLYKTVNGWKKAVSITQDIAEEYNKLAQWLAWPQVPKPFLKKEKK